MELLILAIFLNMLIYFKCKPILEKDYAPEGQNFHLLTGILSSLFGISGMFFINYFFRDKSIIPEELVWIGLIISFIFLVIGTFYMIFIFLKTLRGE